MSATQDSGSSAETDLHENAVAILLYIADQDDEQANTSEISTATSLSSANISGGHAQTLEQQGYIEKAGSVESNAPNNTNVYKLTHQGRKESKRLSKENPVPISDRERDLLLNVLKENLHKLDQPDGTERGSESSATKSEVKELTEAINELNERLTKHDKRLATHEKTLDEHEGLIDKLDSRFSRLTNIVNSLRG